MNLSFSRLLGLGQQTPNDHSTNRDVSVMAENRQHDVCELDSGANDPMPFDLDGYHSVVHGIRNHLRAIQPRTLEPMPPSRGMLVLRAYAVTLETTGQLTEIDRLQMIRAIAAVTAFAAPHLPPSTARKAAQAHEGVSA